MKHILNKIASMPWAITRDGLDGIWKIASREWTAADYEIFHAAAQGEIKAVISDLGEPRGDSETAFVRGDTGILLLDGPIIPRADFFSAMSGMVSLDSLTAEFKDLEADDSIKRIVLLVDSPGGDVTGVSDFADLVRASGKKTISFVYGMAASAAYWIATAADSVVSTKTGIVGSIGVVSIFRKDDDDDTIEIISDQSPLKRADPDTDAGRASIQEMLNDLADVFVESVAVNMGVKKKKVLSDFGQGAVVVAARAQAAGMIDRITTLDTLLSSFENQPAQGGDTGGIQMNLAQFLAENPAAAAELNAQLVAEFERGKAEVNESVAVRVAAAKPFLSSDYGDDIKLIAADVVEGTADVTSLKIAAGTHDKFAERIASLEAKLETQGNGNTTPPPQLDDAQQTVVRANKLREAQGLKPHGQEVH